MGGVEAKNVSKTRRRIENSLIIGGYLFAFLGPVDAIATNIQNTETATTSIDSSSSVTGVHYVANTSEESSKELPYTLPHEKMIFWLGTIPVGYTVVYLGARRRVKEFFLNTANPPSEKI